MYAKVNLPKQKTELNIDVCAKVDDIESVGTA